MHIRVAYLRRLFLVCKNLKSWSTEPPLDSGLSLNILSMKTQNELLSKIMWFLLRFYSLSHHSGKWWTPTTGSDGCPTTRTGSCGRTRDSSTWRTRWACGSLALPPVRPARSPGRYLCTTRCWREQRQSHDHHPAFGLWTDKHPVGSPLSCLT